MATSQRWRWPHEKRTKICSPAGWRTGELLMTVWWNGRESGSQWSLFVPKWSKWMDQIREKLFPSLHCGVAIVGPAGSAAAKFQLSRMLLVLSARFFDYILRRRRHNHQLTAAIFPIVSSAFLLLRGSLLQAEQSTYRKTKRSCQRTVKVEQTSDERQRWRQWRLEVSDRGFVVCVCRSMSPLRCWVGSSARFFRRRCLYRKSFNLALKNRTSRSKETTSYQRGGNNLRLRLSKQRSPKRFTPALNPKPHPSQTATLIQSFS